MGQTVIKLPIIIPHSHTWFLTQTCVQRVLENTPKNGCFEFHVYVVDNSWDWSPSVRGITDTRLGERVKVIQNPRYYLSRMHGSALDVAFNEIDSEFILTIETDAYPLKPGWANLFFAHLERENFAVGAWHIQHFLNPSFTLYRRRAWERMNEWCRSAFTSNPQNSYWGHNFNNVGSITRDEVASIGPFHEKRGFPPGTVLKAYPNGLHRGASFYEPGEQLYHWSVNQGGYTAGFVPHHHTWLNGIPTGTYYGYTQGEDVPRALAVHLWGGTRALDLFKYEVFKRFYGDTSTVSKDDPTIHMHMGYWLDREARQWLSTVPKDIQNETFSLISKHGWSIGDCSEDEINALAFLKDHYNRSGIHFDT